MFRRQIELVGAVAVAVVAVGTPTLAGWMLSAPG
jgi:hypothetical protein